jgi:hypothetical protein
MSVVVSYPVEIRKFEVSVKREIAEIVLEGVELSEQERSVAGANLRRVGVITFGDPNPVSNADFISRGGFLHMDRPLALFSGVMTLLRTEGPLFLGEDGTLSTSPQ